MARVILPGALGNLVQALRTLNATAVATATGHDVAALEALMRLSNAIGLNAALGTPIDDTLVKNAVRELMALPAGSDPSADEIRQYVEPIQELHGRGPAPYTSTAAHAEPAAPLFGRPFPEGRWWVFGVVAVVLPLVAVIATYMIAAKVNGWTAAGALLVPLAVWLLAVASPYFRKTLAVRTLAVAIAAACAACPVDAVLRSTGSAVDNTQQTAHTTAPQGGQPPKTSKKQPLVEVTEIEWNRHRAQAPEHLKALEDLIEGPEGHQVERFPRLFRADMDAAHAKVGTKIAADSNLIAEWDLLKNSPWKHPYTADEACKRLGAARRFAKTYLAADLKEIPDYSSFAYTATVEASGKWARRIADEYQQRLDALNRLVTKAEAVTVPATKPVDEVLEQRKRDEAAALQQKLADARAARRKLLEAQWELAFDEDALACFGHILLPSGTENDKELSGRALKAWQYSRLGPFIGSAKVFSFWFWFDHSPSYWAGTVTTQEKHVAEGKQASADSDPEKKGRNAEERFLERYGEKYGFKSLHEFFVVVAYVNPNRFISHDAAEETKKAIAAATLDRSKPMPADFAKPIPERFAEPVNELRWKLRDFPHPRPEVDPRTKERMKPFIGLTKDEWIRRNMKD